MSIRDNLKSYRVCPDCGARYTVDADTRKRVWMIVFLALMTVGISVVAFQKGYPWSLASLLSGTGLLFYLGYTLSKMSYVKYRIY